MQSYKLLNKQELINEKESLLVAYNAFKEKNLKLDMSRGKPGASQLNLSDGMLDCVNSKTGAIAGGNLDCRNYGILDGLPQIKAMFAQMLEVSTNEIIVLGNSSLNLMYDTILRALQLGVVGSEKPWGKYDKIKFLCPSPGYDRHFSICEQFNIEMIPIAMSEQGPDMDTIEKLVANDDTIKGIWCVPKYSNPQGITYSDETVRRFAGLKPKAKDFRIFWDNAYCIHDLNDKPDKLLNILDECKKLGSEDMVYIFASTSKISYSGSGIAIIAASQKNIEAILKQLSIQTIGPDKINQLRHLEYFKNYDGILNHMEKHKKELNPKFSAVLEALNSEIKDREIACWNVPNGGYFISLDTLEGCAKRVVLLCKEAGVVLTPAGVTFPYANDPKDSNIRIAPTFPPVSELKTAMELFCICLRLASVEKLLGE